jgi:hypothetical protein
MHWPQHRARVQTKRGPRWISPSTASVTVVVNDDPHDVTVANAPKSGHVSTVVVAAPAGEDTFDFTLYDRRQRSTQYPQGNVLGEAEVSQKIAGGQHNVVHATIAGVPSQIGAAPVAAQPFVRTNPAGGYFVIGDSPQQFVVTAMDADSNVIVPQPSVTMRANGAGATYFGVTPNPARAQAFYVRAVAPLPAAGNAAVQLAIGARDSNGNAVSGFLRVAQLSALYVTYGNSPSGGPAVAVYDGSGKMVTLPSSAFAGLTQPGQIAYDGIDRRLYVADAQTNGGQILAFDSVGNPIPGFVLQIPNANLVSYDANDGLLYAGAPTAVNAYKADGAQVQGTGYTQNDDGVAASYYPDGTMVVANGQPQSGGDPLLWFYNESLDSNGSFAPPELSGIYDLTSLSAVDGTYMIMCGVPAGGYGSNLLMEKRNPFSFEISTANVPGCQGVAYDPVSSVVFVTSASSNQIVAVGLNGLGDALGSIDATMTIGTPASSGLSNPQRIAIAY